MKRQFIRFGLLAMLLPFVLVTPSFGQYGTVRETAPGAGWFNAGKTLVWTGAGIALSGVALVSFASLDMASRNVDPNAGLTTSDMATVFALGGAAIGGGLALAGSMMMLAGDNKCHKAGEGDLIRDGKMVSVDPVASRGFGLLLETGGSVILPHVSGRVIGGYHFSPHVFLGGGLGLTVPLLYDVTLIPSAFVDARFSITQKKVAPFIGIDLGGAMRDRVVSPYCHFQAGARIHTMEQHSWWLSGYSEYAPNVISTYGVKAACSF